MSSSTRFRRTVARRSPVAVIFMPGSTTRAQAGAKTRAPTSTTQTRHTPAGSCGGRWQIVGMSIPTARAASKIVVPGGTDTGLPSIVTSIMKARRPR